MDRLLPWEEPEYLASQEEKTESLPRRRCYRNGCSNYTMEDSWFCSEECKTAMYGSGHKTTKVEEMQKKLLEWGRERHDTFTDMVEEIFLTK